MHGTAVEYPSRGCGDKVKSPTAGYIRGLAETAAAARYTTVTPGEKHLCDGLQGRTPLATRGVAESWRFSFAAVAPVERVSPLPSSEKRQTIQCMKHDSQRCRNEASEARPRAQAVSTSLPVRVNNVKHPLAIHFNAVERSIATVTPRTEWPSHFLPTALGHTVREIERRTVVGAVPTSPFLPGAKAALATQPRAGHPGYTSGASTWQLAVTKRDTSAAADVVCGTGGFAETRTRIVSLQGVSESGAYFLKNCAERRTRCAKYEDNASVRATDNNRDATCTACRRTAGQTDTDTRRGYLKNTEKRPGTHSVLQGYAHEEWLASLLSRTVSSAADMSLAAATATGALSKTALRKAATAPNLEMPASSAEPIEKREALQGKNQRQPFRSTQERQTLRGQQQPNLCDVVERCIPDIRTPALQHGTVLFCSYCGKRLVRQKHYMQCWPEFLLCDTCTLLPPCNVCHRKALPAYITLQDPPGASITSGTNAAVKDSTTESSTSMQCNCTLSRSQGRRGTSSATGTTDPQGSVSPSSGSTGRSSPLTRNSNTGSAQGLASRSNAASGSPTTSIVTARHHREQPQTTRIRCDPLHDAEGLHLCGHCALLNPVSTKEGLLRITQYALLWLRERHGVVFSDERLAVQRTPLVQQRVYESLRWRDCLLRSKSAPEQLLLHRLQHSHDKARLLTHGKGGEKVGPRYETEWRRQAASRSLRIDPTENVRPQRAILTDYAVGAAAQTTDEPGATHAASNAQEMEVLIESLRHLCHRPQQLLHTPKQCLTRNGMGPHAQQQEQTCYAQQHQQTTPTHEKWEEDHGTHTHTQRVQVQEQCDPIQEKVGIEQRPLPEDGLGFAIEAVGYSELNVGKKSSVFGRCETERLFYDDLVLPLQVPAERDGQRRALERVVQVSRTDARAAIASSASGLDLRETSCKAEKTWRHPEQQCLQGRLRHSLRCVRRVAVLRFLPESVFLSHLIHELVHAYIWCSQLPEEGPLVLQVEEGICNAVAASFLHERLQKLTVLDAELAGTAIAQDGTTFARMVVERTAARTSSAQQTRQDEPSSTRRESGAAAAVTEGDTGAKCLTAASDEGAAVDARSPPGAHCKRNRKPHEETQREKEKWRELLLLLIRYEARVIRTQLDAMEADEHHCYGKGYRVMRRILQDLQLQQTLHVATRHGYSLESVEKAADSLRSREARNRDTATFPPTVESRTVANSHKASTVTYDVSAKGEPPQQTSLHCGTGGSTLFQGSAGAKSEGSGKPTTSGVAEQRGRTGQHSHCTLSFQRHSAETELSISQQHTHGSDGRTRVRQEQQSQVLSMRTRSIRQDHIALAGAHPLWNTKQRRAPGNEPSRELALPGRARSAAAELMRVVSTVFWQGTARTEGEELRRSATVCRVVAGSG